MIEKRSLSADIAHFSSTLKARFEKAIAEAVVNSVHANATEVQVILDTSKDLRLNSVKIIDNGDGFIRKNCDSFFTLHSSNKKDIGGKGIGRVTWFKFFSNVTVKSDFFEDGNPFRVLFSINKGENKDIDVKREKLQQQTEHRTEIALNIYLGSEVFSISSAAIKSYLIREMVKILHEKKKKGEHFVVSIKKQRQDDELDNASITLDDLPIIEQIYNYTVFFENENHIFSLNCIRLETAYNNRVETGFISGGRTTSNFKDVFGIDIRAPQNKRTGQYWLFLESKLFDDSRFSTPDRESIIIPQYGDSKEELFENIKSGLLNAIGEYFDTITPEHGIEREAILKEISELYPQYESPQYKTILDEMLLTRIGRVEKSYILKKLHEHDFKKGHQLKEELRTILSSKKVNNNIAQETIDIARKTNIQAQEVLIDYMWYRHAILAQLQKFVNDNEKSEKLIHDLFCERYTKHDTPNQSNCIWLLDDKFMQFSYMASEAVCDNVIQDIYQKENIDFHKSKRMDLFILFNKDDTCESRDCVIVEFKSFSVDSDDKVNAVTQVQTRYANTIRKHAPSIQNIYIYIITTIDEEIKSGLISLDFHQSFSRNGYVFTRYFSNTSTFINFVCASAIVGDAKDRHDFFFKLLKEELSYRQRTGIQADTSKCTVQVKLPYQS